jgi:hypothetical protein
VFNVQKISFKPISPLLVAEVVYSSFAERRAQLDAHLSAWVHITSSLNIPDARLDLAAYTAFLFCKVIALTTKHRGFSEEHEFRVIYIPEHDPRGYMRPHLHYHIGPRGLEPKLKFRFGTTLRATIGNGFAEEQTTGTLSELLEFVLLGPTVSSPLAKASFIRMLERNNMAEFKDRVFPSTIPLRPPFAV